MRTLFYLTCIVLVITSCNPLNEPTEKVAHPEKVEHPDRVARNLTVEIATDIGINVGQGTVHVKKSEELLVLQPLEFSVGYSVPILMSMMSANIHGELLQFPLTIGKSWQAKEYRRVNEHITLEKYETVEIPIGTFKQCLKHKTVLTDARYLSQVENALINGTRYLWFAKGIGIVKMRYEHSNGVITEAELIDYKIQDESDVYLPTGQDTTWTYKWKNNYFNETLIENIHIKNGNAFAVNSSFGRQIITNVKTEDGIDRGSGRFYIKKTGTSVRLSSSQMAPKTPNHYKATGAKKPYIVRGFLQNVANGYPEKGLLLYPLTVGKTWKQTSQWLWKTEEEITLDGYESLKVTAGTFPQTLRHKTIMSKANTSAIAQVKERMLLNNALINGTRYLWFAKGIGIVKMRYEHSNGTITEAELIEYHVPAESEEYFPLNLGTSWTYKWKNDYHTKTLIETINVVRASEGNETPIKEAKYTVTIDPDNPSVIQVLGKLIPHDPSTKRVRLVLNSDDTYIDNVKLWDSSSSSSSSSSSPGTRKEWEFLLDDPNSLPLSISYQVSLKHGSHINQKHYEKSVITHKASKLPYERKDCIFWPSKMLFIVGRDCNEITVEFILPKGWHVSTPWKRIGKRGHRFFINNQTELTEPYLLMGKHSVEVAKSGETEIVLAIGDSLMATKDEMKNSVQKFLSVYSELFGGGPSIPMLFIINPYEERQENRMEGNGSGHTISILMDSTLAETNRHEWGPFLAHEVFHVWNGLSALDNFSNKEHWFKEGVTDFYADITAARLGYLSEREYLNRLEHAYEAYISVPRKLTISNSTDNRLSYNGGSLVTAALDIEIRELTENTKSFDEVMRQIYHKFRYFSSGYIRQEDIIAAVNAVGGTDFEPFFQTHVYGKERLQLTEYFAKAGLDVQINHNEELPTSASVAEVIRESLGRESTVYVSAVNSMRIRTSKELSKLAKEWKTGDVLELTYGELGEMDKHITEKVKLTGISDSLPTVPEISVRITKMENPTKLQRAIFADILGINSKQ